MKSNKDLIKKIFIIILLISSAIVLTSCRLWTVVELNKESASEGEIIVHLNGQEIGLETYVETLWTDKIIPYMNTKANNLPTVLDEIESGTDKAGSKYGLRESAGKPWKFIVEGKARILSVNTESRVGTIDVDVEPYDKSTNIKIQIGPVIRGSSIRDSLDFISFNNFENQIEYAKLSTAINNKVNNDILQVINFEEGQEIVFQGVFVVDDSEVILTPVKLEVIGGSKNGAEN